MNRRQMISNLLYATGGIIIAKDLELIERLTPKNYVSGIDLRKIYYCEPEGIDLDLTKDEIIYELFSISDDGRRYDRKWYTAQALNELRLKGSSWYMIKSEVWLNRKLIST